VWLRFGAVAAILVLCNGCASPYFFHDPQLGWISAEQVPDILKSVRCELVTFYEANRSRQAAFITQVAAPGDRAENFRLATQNFSYFKVDENQYGMLYLDLKVIDSIGVGSATTFDNKLVRSAESTRVFHLGPTLGDQNTYELVWNFAIRQDAHLSSSEQSALGYSENGVDKFTCYDNLSANRENMARNEIPSGLAQFKRIWVNGTEPLAAWLLDNNRTIGSSFFARTDGEAAEQIIPTQMLYNFSIQTSAGLDSKISVTGLRWNPAVVDAAASSQQTSTLAFYVNGPMAQAANAAKGGQAAISSPIPKPIHVIIDKDKQAKILDLPAATDELKKRGFSAAGPKPKRNKQSTVKVPAYLKDNSRGFLTYPLTINPPVPGQ
jgi:hypothetical protein